MLASGTARARIVVRVFFVHRGRHRREGGLHGRDQRVVGGREIDRARSAAKSAPRRAPRRARPADRCGTASRPRPRRRAWPAARAWLPLPSRRRPTGRPRGHGRRRQPRVRASSPRGVQLEPCSGGVPYHVHRFGARRLGPDRPRRRDVARVREARLEERRLRRPEHQLHPQPRQNVELTDSQPEPGRPAAPSGAGRDEGVCGHHEQEQRKIGQVEPARGRPVAAG